MMSIRFLLAARDCQSPLHTQRSLQMDTMSSIRRARQCVWSRDVPLVLFSGRPLVAIILIESGERLRRQPASDSDADKGSYLRRASKCR